MNLRSFMTGYGTYVEIALIAGLCGASAWGGWALKDRAFQKHLRKDAEIAARIGKASQEITTGIIELKAQRDAKQKVVTQTLIKRIPEYVPSRPLTQSGADVTIGFGRLHDYAALGVVPPSPGPDRDTLAGIGMPAVAGTIVRNYGLCHDYASEIEAWRGWYVRNKKLWEGK